MFFIQANEGSYKSSVMKKKNKLSKETSRNKAKTLPATEQRAIWDSPMDEDISGSRKPISSAKPDMLREDHPGLAK